MEIPRPQPAHPTTRTYLMVGLVLAIVTAVEVGVVYVQSLKGVILPILFTLSAAKFATVAGFFMHLRFDNKFLTWGFAAGLFLAVVFGLALMYLLRV